MVGVKTTISKRKGVEPLLTHHFNNVKNRTTVYKGKYPTGETRSVFSMQVKDEKLNKGKPTLIPSIYDGKELPEKQAIQKAIASGIKWTSADTDKELRAYDKNLHKTISNELDTSDNTSSDNPKFKKDRVPAKSFSKGGPVKKRVLFPITKRGVMQIARTK